ncbi:MAG: preprotein translocase subunit SecE [Clostridia bacterium]|nr:preprotein translocase subunit SecE [Clostridia bacterium]
MMAENEKNEVVKAEEKKAAPEKAEKKADKPSFFKRAGASIKRFLRENKAELKKIVWYDKKSTIRSSIIVVVAILVSALFLGILDFGFSQGLMALGKLV